MSRMAAKFIVCVGADETKFWASVAKSNDCWPWTGHIGGDGYGVFSIGGTAFGAHRVSYVLTNGNPPPDEVLDHLCRNRRCVNPSHLESVTVGENTMRGQTIPALHAAKTHCCNGHAFDVVNTYTWRGHRVCRACNRAAVARRKARMQAAA